MKNVKSGKKADTCMCIATTKTKPDTRRLIKEKSVLNISLMIVFVGGIYFVMCEPTGLAAFLKITENLP
jgi:hypothetical protein